MSNSRNKRIPTEHQLTAKNIAPPQLPPDKCCPVWSFKNVDKNGLFKFDPKRTDFDHKEFLDKILDYSTMTWSEIKKQTHDKGKSKHHILSYESLSEEAQARIKAKQVDDLTDNIFSFALNNLVRVIGIRKVDSPEFQVMWYDPKHEFAPGKK